MHILQQQRGRRPALGRRGHDDGIAALERVDDLVGGRRARIGGRRNRRDHAHRPRNLDDAQVRILRDHADRLCALEVTQQAHGLALVLGELVRHVAQARVVDCEFGQAPVVLRLDDGPARGGDDLIDPHLVVALVHPLGRARARDQCTDDLFRSERRCGFFRYCSHGITILKQSTKSIPVLSRPAGSARPISSARPSPSGRDPLRNCPPHRRLAPAASASLPATGRAGRPPVACVP